MDQLEFKLDFINNRLNALVEKNKDIRALVYIGSYSQESFDNYSDIDLLLFTDNPSRYMHWDHAEWAAPLGKVISRRIFPDRGDGVDKNKIVLDNGTMYDFAFIPLKQFRMMHTYLAMRQRGVLFLLPGFLRRIADTGISRFYETIRRGCRIQHDTIGLGKMIPYLQEHYAKKQPAFPDKHSFANSYNNFWQSCYTASIKLIKGEYYHNLLLYDNYMKHQILRAIEWLAITKDPATDVFYNGVRLEQWAGRDVYERILPTLFHQDILEMQHCLLRSIALYQELSGALAAAYGFPLNKHFEDFVTAFIEQTAIPHTQNRLAKYNNIIS